MITDSSSAKLSLEDLGGSILPAQYFEPLKQRKLLNGERRLLLAVLEDAVRSYLSNMSRTSIEQRREFAQVQRWFHSPHDAQGLFSFESICDLLGIDANIFRKRLDAIGIHNLAPRHRLLRRSPLVVARRRHASRSRA
jgi:hypothetical protein